MKKLFVLLALSVLSLTSCTTEGTDMRWVCSPTQNARVQEFISSQIKNANNMSDEEMEDVISQLESTGIHINCNYRAVKYIYNSQEHDMVYPDLADSLTIHY